MLFRRTVEQSARRSTFLVKGVIEIIFNGEILAKFPSHEDSSSSTTSFGNIYLARFSYYQYGVGYCFIRDQGNARSLTIRVEQYVPTPIFYLMLNGRNREARGERTMTTNKREVAYEAPQVDVIEVQVEKGFAASNGEDDPTITNPGMGWGF